MRVVLTGGTGLIGTALTHALADAGHEVVVLTRRQPGDVLGLPSGARAERWPPAEPAGWAEVLAGSGAVVNLAGASVGARPWTAGRRREILESRLRGLKENVIIGKLIPAGTGLDYYKKQREQAARMMEEEPIDLEMLSV